MNSLIKNAHFAVGLVRGPDQLVVAGFKGNVLAAPPTEFSLAVEKHDLDGIYAITATPLAPTAAVTWLPGSYILALHAATSDSKGTTFTGSTLVAFEVP